jgi:hypothetical protein
MSEYQYYEFQAIDRPLTSSEIDKLRSYSTRARITSTSFVNDYSWGSFKGDEDAWMEKYFDAFLYLANWGTHVLKLRLPSHLLDVRTAKEYCGGESVREKAGKVIVSFLSEDEEGDDWVEGEDQLSSMISVRADLARGDLRALYLGWLLRAQIGNLNDDGVEPPMPPGLGQLSGSIESLAEFLRIDGDLIDVAAQASPPLNDAAATRPALQAWVANLPDKEKDETLAKLILGGDHAVIAALQQRFFKAHADEITKPARVRRTVAALLRAAEEQSEKRRRAEAKLCAKATARREREAALAREKHLKSLAGREGKLWADVKSLVASKRQLDFDRAVTILVDLRDLAAGEAGSDFQLRVRELRQMHARKRTFLERLEIAGL